MQIYEEDQHLNDLLHLPCPSCGSQLAYSAEKKKISCGYCGYLEEVNTANDQVVERSLNEAIDSVAEYSPEEIDKKVCKCDGCGAEFMVESNIPKASCGFCGSEKVNVQAFDHQYIKPVGIIPFYISKVEAEKHFTKWINQGFFHPNKLKKLASMENLHGVYIPFWTYDAQTEANWSGEAGYHYNETIRVNVNGQMKAQNVSKIRWQYRKGNLKHFFDDVLVVASGGLKQKEISKALPYRLEEVVNFDPRLMIGWEAEVYKLQVDEGFQVADKIMDDRLRNMCSAQLGGDTQRNLHVHSSKHSQTFKHIILPLWICSYRYQNEIFHFFINGQTGRVSGKKPISWFKVGFLILLFILFIIGVWYLRESGVFRK